MVFTVSIGASIVILAMLIFLVPLHFSFRGKMIILVTSILISLLGLIGQKAMPLWEIASFQLVLASLITYIFSKRFASAFSGVDGEISKNEQELKPLFKYSDLKEKAKMHETLDEYYSQPIKKNKPLKDINLEHSIVVNGNGNEGKRESEYLDVYSHGNDKAIVSEGLDNELNPETERIDSIAENDSFTELQDRTILLDNEIHGLSEMINLEERFTNQSKAVKTAFQSQYIDEAASSTEDDDLTQLIRARISLYDETDLVSDQEFEYVSVAQPPHMVNDASYSLDEGKIELDNDSKLNPEKADDNKYSNEALEFAFEDLEELYLKNRQTGNKKELQQ
jgi:hypothetical protein